MLAAIDDAGHNGITDKHIERVAVAIRNSGLTYIDDSSFARICRGVGIDSTNFTADDIEKLNHLLNG